MAMTITSVCVIDYESTQDDNGRQHVITYLVRYTGEYNSFTLLYPPATTPVQLPWYGAVLGDDPYCSCRNLSPKYREMPNVGERICTVVATYKQGTWNEDPLLRPDDLEFQLAEEGREIFLDADDKPIVTSAGEMFAQKPSIPIGVLTATITGYRSGYRYPPFDVTKWQVTNSNVYTIDGISVDIGQSRLAGVTAHKERINNHVVYRHTWLLRFKEKFNLEVANMGFMQKVGGALQTIYRNNQRVEQPYPLDLAGKALPANYNPVTDIKKITFKTTKTFDFSYFGWHF